jgi:hypothetical protein
MAAIPISLHIVDASGCPTAPDAHFILTHLSAAVNRIWGRIGQSSCNIGMAGLRIS